MTFTFFLSLLSFWLDSWRQHEKMHLKQMSLRQCFEWKENKSLLSAFLPTLLLLYFGLTYALKGTYKVLNQLSIYHHQDISWQQLKD